MECGSTIQTRTEPDVRFLLRSNLAKGRDLETSVEAAKRYISGALEAMLDLGFGSGPMNHGFAIKEEW